MGVLDCELKLEILAKKSAERTEPCHVQLVVTGYVAFPMADRWQGNIIYVALRSQEETGTGSSAKQTWDCPGSASCQFIIMTLFYIVCIMCKCLFVCPKSTALREKNLWKSIFSRDSGD